MNFSSLQVVEREKKEYSGVHLVPFQMQIGETSCFWAATNHGTNVLSRLSCMKRVRRVSAMKQAPVSSSNGLVPSPGTLEKVAEEEKNQGSRSRFEHEERTCTGPGFKS